MYPIRIITSSWWYNNSLFTSHILQFKSCTNSNLHQEKNCNNSTEEFCTFPFWDVTCNMYVHYHPIVTTIETCMAYKHFQPAPNKCEACYLPHLSFLWYTARLVDYNYCSCVPHWKSSLIPNMMWALVWE